MEDLLRSHETPRQDGDPSSVADAIAQPRRNGLGEHVGERKKTEGIAAPHDPSPDSFQYEIEIDSEHYRVSDSPGPWRVLIETLMATK